MKKRKQKEKSRTCFVTRLFIFVVYLFYISNLMRIGFLVLLSLWYWVNVKRWQGWVRETEREKILLWSGLKFSTLGRNVINISFSQ